MFNIEESIALIPEEKTKILFKEVFSSYTTGNFRSAIVMLWSVVICDIIFKLQYLENVYQDRTAIAILKEVKNMQTENPTSAEWEYKIMDLLSKRTKFLDVYEKGQLEYLHQQRHLCAHPILDNNDLLLQPTRESVRNLLRAALEGILLKTPILSKELVDIFTTDLENKKTILNDYEAIKAYITSKYTPSLNEIRVKELIPALWKFTFNPNTAQEKNNIYINFAALLILIEKYKTTILDDIQKNITTKYSIRDSDQNTLDMFTSLLIKNPWIYPILSDATKLIINKHIQGLDKFFSATFVSKDIISHMNKIIEKINSGESWKEDIESLRELENQAKENGTENEFYNFCIDLYVKSSTFNSANIRFDICIKPYINNLSKDLLGSLITYIDRNNQTWLRKRACYDHKFILDKYKELSGDMKIIDNLSAWNEFKDKV